MATTPLRKCPAPGCRELVHTARCEKHSKANTRERETLRGTARERGYTTRWDATSLSYRADNPLCVECLFAEKAKAAQCVDHIIPHAGRYDLMWDVENYCSLCHWHHSRKTAAEQERPLWEPRADRYVICGLPATGKTTRANAIARQLGCDVFDWDEQATAIGLDSTKTLNADEYSRLMDIRKRWLWGHRGSAAVMIVSRPCTAYEIAANMEARIIHCICDESERGRRIAARTR